MAVQRELFQKIGLKREEDLSGGFIGMEMMRENV